MKKKILSTLCILLVLLGIIFINIINKPLVGKELLKNQQFIAHALGAIEDYTYTNSKEAFLYNYEQGIRLFEVDLSITTDNHFVCRHDWLDHMFPILGQEKIIDEDNAPLSLEQFKSLPIHNKYTSISLLELLELLQEHKDAYIILDTKSVHTEFIEQEYKLLIDTVNSIDKKLLDRIIPQIYNREMFATISKFYNFPTVLYTLYQEAASNDEALEFAIENNISALVMSMDRFSEDFISKLNENNILSYVHTINEEGVFDYLTSVGVTGVYTDFLNPSVLNLNN